MNSDSSIYRFISKQGSNALIVVLIILVWSLLTGCIPVTPEMSETPPLFSCVRFGYSHWTEFNFGFDSSSPDELIATVNRLYDIDREQLLIDSSHPKDEIRRVNWVDNSVDYFAYFSVGEQLIDVEVHWGRWKPTLSQVIDCLGPPDNYYETSNSEGTGTEKVSYWTVKTDEESPIPGYVTLLVIEGVLLHNSESPPQANHPVHRVKQFTVFAVSMPQQIIDTSQLFSCAKFSASRWQEFRFGVDSPADVFATVVKLWGHDKGQVVVDETVNVGSLSLRWHDAKEEIHYVATFVGGQLDRIDVLFVPVPTLAQVIDCLGPPDYYIANGGPGEESTGLQVWYVEQGFVANGHVFHTFPWQKPLEAIPSGFGMYAFHVFPAGIEQIARRFNYVDGDGDPIMCILEPWPGSIEAIEIREEPFFTCYFSTTD